MLWRPADWHCQRGWVGRPARRALHANWFMRGEAARGRARLCVPARSRVLVLRVLEKLRTKKLCARFAFQSTHHRASKKKVIVRARSNPIAHAQKEKPRINGAFPKRTLKVFRAYLSCRSVNAPMPAATFRPVLPSMLMGCRVIECLKPPTSTCTPAPTAAVALAVAPA